MEADHIIPHSFGGPTAVVNPQTSHRRCNLAKAMRTWDLRPGQVEWFLLELSIANLEFELLMS
jgi:5-methylcytosine-specific restriction endonuclease McrA